MLEELAALAAADTADPRDIDALQPVADDVVCAPLFVPASTELAGVPIPAEGPV